MVPILDSYSRYKDLLVQLVLREIKGKYKQSILGYAWVLLVPLMNLVVLSIVFSYLFRVPTGNVPYPMYLFVGLVPWTFLTTAIVLATQSLNSNASVITKIYLPREIFPISAVIAKLVDLLLTSLVLVAFLVFFQIAPHVTLLYLPLILLVQILLILGIAFFLSAINVFFHDIEHMLPVFLTIWMYLTPIIYSPELIPNHLRPYFSLNPMTGIINAYRNTILYGAAPPWQSFSFSILISLVIFLFGYWFFKNRSKYFADVI